MAGRKKKSQWEEQLWWWLESRYEGDFIREFRFHPTRRWRFDFACQQEHLAIEIDGILYGGRYGAHQRPKGMERDREKDAEAMMLGWRVLRITPKQMTSGKAMEYIEALMRR